jgi:hypothetical protein
MNLLYITGQDCPEWNLPVKASANFTRAWSCRFEYLVKNQSGTIVRNPVMWDEMPIAADKPIYPQSAPIRFLIRVYPRSSAVRFWFCSLPLLSCFAFAKSQ